MYVCMYVCMDMYVCMCSFACMYVCMYVCMHYECNLLDLSTNIFNGVFHENGRVWIALGHLRLT